MVGPCGSWAMIRARGEGTWLLHYLVPNPDLPHHLYGLVVVLHLRDLHDLVPLLLDDARLLDDHLLDDHLLGAPTGGGGGRGGGGRVG